MATQAALDDRIILNTYEDVREGLRQRDLKQALYEAGGVVMNDSLITLHGDEHKVRRRAENRLFRRGTFRWWELNLVPDIIEQNYKPVLDHGHADLVHLGQRTIMYLTALVAGIDPPDNPSDADELQRLAELFSSGATAIHTVRDRDTLNREVAEAMEAFDHQFLSPSWERRTALIESFNSGSLHENEIPKDVLTALLRQNHELGMSRPQIRREVAFYLQAGSHSTANLFTHTAHHIFQRIDQPLFTNQLEDPAFVQRCVLETLRLKPASPVAWRRSLAEITLKSGSTIPKGALVEFDLQSANTDPHVWGADSTEFNPDRELPPGVPLHGHSFGGGMHACIGMELDGGVQSIAHNEDEVPVYGTVALMIQALLANGARPIPNDPPALDLSTTRENFASYPVQFGSHN